MDDFIRRFAVDLLTHLGATVAPEGDDRVVVSLPPEWASRFDHREVLSFAFAPEAMREGEPTELLIPGSYWLERLLEIAQERGEVSALRLGIPPGSEELFRSPPQGLEFRNAAASVRSYELTQRLFLLVHFKISFLSDDIEEDLWPVLVDLASGGVEGGPQGFSLTDGYSFAVEGGEAGWKEGEPDEEATQITLDAALSLARKEAEAEAGRRADEKDREIELRLQDELLRLDTFYSELLQESERERGRASRRGGEEEGDPQAGHHRLQQEKQRRQQEALDKFQLKVLIRPVNAALVRAPVLKQLLDLANDTSTGNAIVLQELVGGKVRPPACSECGEAHREILLCRKGHVVGPACSEDCVHCGHLYCHSCDLLTCALCHRHTCWDCSEECSDCGERVCKEHVRFCEDTGARVCPRCATDCPACHRRYQEERVRNCALGEERVCRQCITRCRVCLRSVCPEHTFECAACGRPVCTDERVRCPQCLQRFCRGCVRDGEVCPTCRGLFSVLHAQDAILSVLKADGRRLPGFRKWQMSEDREHFLVVGRRWWRHHLFVLDKASLRVLIWRRISRLKRG